MHWFDRLSRHQQGAIAWIVRLALILVFLGGWEYLTANDIADPFFWGQPTGIADFTREWASSGELTRDIGATLSETFIGLAIGVIAGVALGIWLGLSRFSRLVLQPFVDMANSTPRFALAPLFVLWLGLGIASKVGVVVSIVVFIMMINTTSGVLNVDRDQLRLLRVMGGSKRDEVRYIVLPATVSWIKAGLRLAIPYAIAGAVIGEFVAADKGLGYVLVQSSGALNTNGVLSAVLILAILGTAMNWASNRLLRDSSERRAPGVIRSWRLRRERSRGGADGPASLALITSGRAKK